MLSPVFHLELYKQQNIEKRKRVDFNLSTIQGYLY